MNKTAKNSMIYLSGTIIQALIGFVSTMVLTRFLSQKVYAMYGLLATFHTAVNMFSSFGFDSAYMRFYYKHGYSPKKYLLMCLKYPLMVMALVTLVLIAPGQHLVRYIFDSPLSTVAMIALVLYFLLSFFHRFSQLTARMEEYAGNYVLSNLVAKSGFILQLLLIYFMFKNVSFEWVILSFAITNALAVMINLYVYKKMKTEINPEGEAVTQKQLFKYGYPTMINNVIILVIPVMEKLIIRDLAGWEVLSMYTAASVFQTVVLLLVNTITNVWNPIVFKQCDNEEKFKPILHTFGLVGTVLLVMGTAACILLRRWLVLLLDASYFEVYVIAPAMLLTSCFNIVSIIYSVGINIKHKTGHLVIGPTLQAIASLGLCYLLIPALGLKGVAISVLVSVGISRLYRITIGLRLYNTGQKEIKAIMLVAVSVVAAIASLFLTSLITDIILSVALCVTATVIINKEMAPVLKTIVSFVKPKGKKINKGEE